MKRKSKSSLLAVTTTLLLCAHHSFAAPKCEESFLLPSTYEKNLSGEKNPLLNVQLGGIKESESFTRDGIALIGQLQPIFKSVESDFQSYISNNSGIAFDGVQYFEFPNSTSLTTKNSVTGQSREFMITRGVREYTPRIGLKNGENSPQNYVSDVLLFERVDGKYVYVSRLLASRPEVKFFFEDPRISVVRDDRGNIKHILSGTDYSSHVKGDDNPDVMNRYVELKIDVHGLPKPVELNELGRPDFKNLSPSPLRLEDGGIVKTDAKNATIAINEKGQPVVRTRLRPDFNNSYIKELMKHSTNNKSAWSYAEQVFVFKNWKAFEDYNWDDALLDLFDDKKIFERSSTSSPLLAKNIIKDTDLIEHLASQQQNVELPTDRHKGLGPGTRPLRIRRQNQKLYLSEGPGFPEFMSGSISAKESDSFPMAEGEVIFLTFDHEIRYFTQQINDSVFLRRHYSASIKIFDETLTKIIHYLPDVIQPKTVYERGFASGILDLQHVYPMGWVFTGSQSDTRVRVYAGASDAHTTLYLFNIKKLLNEIKTKP